MKYQVLRGFCLGGGVDLLPGQVTELSDHAAEVFLRQGRIQPLAEPAAVDMNKASLLATIALAESFDALNELVTEDETDTEIITAYQLRAIELEEEENK